MVHLMLKPYGLSPKIFIWELLLQLKQFRAREEIQLLQAEAQALKAWVLRQLHVCQMILGQPDIHQFY